MGHDWRNKKRRRPAPPAPAGKTTVDTVEGAEGATGPISVTTDIGQAALAVPKKRKQVKNSSDTGGARKRPTPWDGLQGWKAVDINDEFLLGAEDGGFAGLEELDGATVLDGVTGWDDAAAVAAAPLAKELKQKTKKKAKTGGAVINSTAAGGTISDVDELQARVAALEAENQALRRQSGGGAGTSTGAVPGSAKARHKADAATISGVPSSSHRVEPTQSGKRGKGTRGPVDRSAAVDTAAGGAAVADKETMAASASEPSAKDGKNSAKKTKKQPPHGVAHAAVDPDDPSSSGHSAGGTANAEAAAAVAAVDTSAWAAFGLHAELLAVLGQLGFSTPTAVQKACVPSAIRDHTDVIGAAQTGSGKTLAFGLPILQALLQERDDQAAGPGPGSSATAKPAGRRQRELAGQQGGQLRGLILAPTRELALQVCSHLQPFGRACGVRVVPIVGGLALVKQQRYLRQCPQVVVATPGRLWELMRDGNQHLCRLEGLRFLVLDEADRMVQQGHFQELSSILDMVPYPNKRPGGRKGSKGGGPADDADNVDDVLPGAVASAAAAAANEDGVGGALVDSGTLQPSPAVAKAPLQTLVFSATLTLPLSLRKRLRKGGGGAGGGTASLESLMDRIQFRGSPTVVDLTTDSRMADRLTEAVAHCMEDERDALLYYLLVSHPGRTLVFVNAVSATRRVAALLRLLGLPVLTLHAQQQQRQRLKALDRFKAGDQAVMVATDVAARGLDITGVQCVIHYQLPASVDTYIHRSGRTARAQSEGLSLAIVTPREVARFNALLKALDRPSPPTFPVDKSLMPQVVQRMKLAVQIDEVERKQRKGKADSGWARTNADEAGIVLSDDDLGDSDDEDGPGGGGGGVTAKEAAEIAGCRHQLSQLLAQPIQTRLSGRYLASGVTASLLLQRSAVALARTTTSGAKAAKPAKAKAKAAATAAGAAAAGGDAAAGAAADAFGAGVAQVVAMANRSRINKAAAAAALQTQRASKGLSTRKRKAAVAAAAAAGAAASAAGRRGAAAVPLSRNAVKRARGGGGQRGMVVIPPAFGRDAQGPNALEALRARLALIK